MAETKAKPGHSATASERLSRTGNILTGTPAVILLAVILLAAGGWLARQQSRPAYSNRGATRPAGGQLQVIQSDQSPANASPASPLPPAIAPQSASETPTGQPVGPAPTTSGESLQPSLISHNATAGSNTLQSGPAQ